MTSSDHENKTGKKTKGKLKIEIKKIEKHSSRHVTFSKRRSGLFKKANELSIATGAQVGILVESVSGKKVFTYGNPDVDSIIDRFEKIFPDATRLKQDKEAEEKEKKIIEDEVDEVSKQVEGNFWWNRDVNELDVDELVKHLAALEELKKNVMERAEQLKIIEDQSKAIRSVDSTSTATSVSGGDDRSFHHQPDYVDLVIDRFLAGNSSNAPSIGSGIDQLAAVDDVSGTHEELDLELRL